LNSLEQRKCTVEDIKLLQAKVTKNSKDIASVKVYGEKTRERVRALE
jgi:hypothetical protein